MADRYIVAVLDDNENHRELTAEVLRDAGHIALLFDAPQSLPPAWRADAIITIRSPLTTTGRSSPM